MTECPRFIYAYAEMVSVAEDVRKNRAQGDQALVDAGKLSAHDAATQLRISTAITVHCIASASMGLPPLDRTADAPRVLPR